MLGRPHATVADTFVGLGGDSLSYVEVSTRLGERLGQLPPSWPSLSATAAGVVPAVVRRSLAQPARRRRTVPVDITVVLRAVAITLVVVTHVDLFQLQGGAHVLLAVAGYNLARFQLAVPDRRERVLGLLRSARAVALPAVLFVGALAAVGHDYRWPTAFLVNGVLGGDRWDEQWQFWFLEALVWSYLGLGLLLAVPLVARAQRAAPFGSAVVLLGVALGVRYGWTGVEAGDHRALHARGRGLVRGARDLRAGTRGRCRRSCWSRPSPSWPRSGFFGDREREAIVVVGVLLLLAGRRCGCPRGPRLRSGCSASASLWIYLVHWQVYPPLEDSGHQVWALLASLAVGVTAHAAVTWASRRVRTWRRAAPVLRRGRPFGGRLNGARVAAG